MVIPPITGRYLFNPGERPVPEGESTALAAAAYYRGKAPPLDSPRRINPSLLPNVNLPVMCGLNRCSLCGAADHGYVRGKVG
jgi:hypothetical protein